MILGGFFLSSSVVDRHPFDVDPDPNLTFHFDADPDPDPDCGNGIKTVAIHMRVLTQV